MATMSVTLICLPLMLLSVYLTEVNAVGYCPSYCDIHGVFHQPIHCHFHPEIYCCGSAFHMSCCANKSRDISGLYPEKYNCRQNTWFQIHWQVMITMTGTILLVMLFSACCCQCCRICGEKVREREHRIRFSARETDTTSTVTDADGNQYVTGTAQAEGGEGGQVTIQMFNPASPFAFTPPEYADVTKDPPKYSEVFGADGGGNLNPCYVPDTPPPPFTETAQGQEQVQGHPLSGTEMLQPPASQEIERTSVTNNVTTNDDQDVPTNGEVQPLNQDNEFVDVDLSRDTDYVTAGPEADHHDEYEALRHNEQPHVHVETIMADDPPPYEAPEDSVPTPVHSDNR